MGQSDRLGPPRRLRPGDSLVGDPVDEADRVAGVAAATEILCCGAPADDGVRGVFDSRREAQLDPTVPGADAARARDPGGLRLSGDRDPIRLDALAQGRREAEKDRGSVHAGERAERALWAGTAFVAGVGEEITWRGVQTALLQRLTGNFLAAVAICIVMFSIAHAIQGWRGVAAIAVFAAGFHLLVWLARSLYVAMAVHFVYDLVAGFSYGHLGRKLGYALPESNGVAPVPATDSVNAAAWSRARGEGAAIRYRGLRTNIRSRSSAFCDANHLNIGRGIGQNIFRCSCALALATAMCTVPTGFASDPPPGPAIPVTPMPYGRCRSARGCRAPARPRLPPKPRRSLRSGLDRRPRSRSSTSRRSRRRRRCSNGSCRGRR